MRRVLLVALAVVAAAVVAVKAEDDRLRRVCGPAACPGGCPCWAELDDLPPAPDELGLI